MYLMIVLLFLHIMCFLSYSHIWAFFTYLIQSYFGQLVTNTLIAMPGGVLCKSFILKIISIEIRIFSILVSCIWLFMLKQLILVIYNIWRYGTYTYQLQISNCHDIVYIIHDIYELFTYNLLHQIVLRQPVLISWRFVLLNIFMIRIFQMPLLLIYYQPMLFNPNKYYALLYQMRQKLIDNIQETKVTFEWGRVLHNSPPRKRCV